VRAPWLLAQPYAHRGLWGRVFGPPENSLAAFEAARRARVGVELDVRRTRDGEAIVFHDATLERMTGAPGAVAELDAGAFRALSLLGGAQRPPLLSEALEAAGRHTPVLVELKVAPGDEGPLEAAVAPILAAFDGRTAVMSFNPRTVALMREAAPSLAIGLLIDGWRILTHQPTALLSRLDLQHLAPDFLACGLDALRTHGRPTADRLACPLLAWTVRTPTQLAAARRTADQSIFEHVPPALVTGGRRA
jgi:glycerophosphoryl diester phosphodiesterase